MSVVGALATPEDDQVAEYLRSHDMLSLLEVQLEDRIRDAKDKDKRAKLIEELSDSYLIQLRSYDKSNPYRQIIVNRAQSLVERMDSVPMYELRIELLIEGYLSVESKVELARLELLDSAQRRVAIDQLTDMNRQLNAMVSKLDPAVAQLARLHARSNKNIEQQSHDDLADLRRYRSLGHYYHAWTGYSLAVLKNQHVPSDVFISFAWLLGAEGGMPQFSKFNETTLEFEHVARSAIGVALSYAQSEDALSGRVWANFVADSEYTEPDAIEAAQDRLIQIMADNRDWIDTYRYVLFIEKQRGIDQSMRVAQARYLALQSLDAMQSTRVGRGGMSEARKVAQYSIEQLVEQGEIGHVLDLYKKFETLPLVSDSFITNYARALGELNKAERAGRSGLYASVAALFAQALEAPDADRFPDERDDCALKLAYTEIRSRRATEAIKICDLLIDKSSKESVIEEARWMRIAAIDSININAGHTTSDELDKAVREYIIAYPSTARSAQLILRHAMQGTIDSKVAIDTLSTILDGDPIVIPARRTLVQLQYKRLRALRFSDQTLLAQVLNTIRWIGQNESTEITDLNEARSRLGTIRIGLDLALRVSPPDLDFAGQLTTRGMGLIAYDDSFGSYRSEFVYRQLEIAVLSQQSGDAVDLLGELESLDPDRADSARILIFNDAILQWQQRQSGRNARRLVDLGSAVLAKQTPAYPEPLGIQVSTVAEMIAQAAAYLWASNDDREARDLAMRVSLLVLDRGNPSEPGLQRTAHLAAQFNDNQHELQAWLRLLAAYPTADDRWYQARYESLRVMKLIEFSRALNAYDQYKVLHPNLGPAPWNAKIASLFGDSITGVERSPDGDSP